VLAILENAWKKPNSINWWVAPVYSQSKIGYRLLKRILKDTDLIAKKSDNDLYIELINGSLIEFKSAERPDTLHGEGLSMCVIDEAARIDENVWYEALRPALMDTGGRAMIISTPKRKSRWFYREWLKGKVGEPDYASWQLPSYGNPYIPREELDRLRENLPLIVYKEQILAEFIDDTGSVFKNVEACIDETIVVPEFPRPDRIYVMGVDLARYEDFTVITVLDQDGRVVYWDRFNNLAWAVQKEKIKQVANLYRAYVVVDSTGLGDPVLEQLKAEGLFVTGFKFTATTKMMLIQKLMLAFENQLIKLPKIPELFKELESFEYEITPSGMLKYKSVSGHDDCVMSLALAVWGLRRSEMNLYVMRYNAPTYEKRWEDDLVY